MFNCYYNNFDNTNSTTISTTTTTTYNKINNNNNNAWIGKIGHTNVAINTFLDEYVIYVCLIYQAFQRSVTVYI